MEERPGRLLVKTQAQLSFWKVQSTPRFTAHSGNPARMSILLKYSAVIKLVVIYHQDTIRFLCGRNRWQCPHNRILPLWLPIAAVERERGPRGSERSISEIGKGNPLCFLTLNGVDDASVTWARYQESRGPDWPESCQISRSVDSSNLVLLLAAACKTLRRANQIDVLRLTCFDESV